MDIQTARDNIGKEVVLNEDTKPYKFANGIYKDKSSVIQMTESKKLVITHVDGVGDVFIAVYDKNNNLIGRHHIFATHLSLATPTLQEMDELEEPKNTVLDTLSVDVSVSSIESVELRLAIFNGDTSRTLEQMKEIEAWLLNK